LAIPQVRPDLVPRPRLLERLDQQVAHQLLVVCTPAGFGKTSLLAS
jgi:LuxR family transcriptional regulator, maltose regulon positive regulatory protein